MGDGVAHVGVERGAAFHVGSQPELEHRDAASSGAFGRIQRHVGIAQQVGAFVGAGLGDTDRTTTGDAASVDPGRTAQDLKQTLRHDLHGLAVGHAMGDHREFVASQSRHHVAGPHRVGQPARGFDQQRVAGRMAEAVVDELEVVEVDQQRRHAGVARPRI